MAKSTLVPLTSADSDAHHKNFVGQHAYDYRSDLQKKQVVDAYCPQKIVHGYNCATDYQIALLPSHYMHQCCITFRGVRAYTYSPSLDAMSCVTFLSLSWTAGVRLRSRAISLTRTTPTGCCWRWNCVCIYTCVHFSVTVLVTCHMCYTCTMCAWVPVSTCLDILQSTPSIISWPRGSSYWQTIEIMASKT